MKIYNKTFLFVGFVIIAVPNFFPQYQNDYKYFLQLGGFVLMVFAFIKPIKRKKSIN